MKKVVGGCFTTLLFPLDEEDGAAEMLHHKIPAGLATRERKVTISILLKEWALGTSSIHRWPPLMSTHSYIIIFYGSLGGRPHYSAPNEVGVSDLRRFILEPMPLQLSQKGGR